MQNISESEMTNKSYGQVYAIVDPFPEQLGGRVQYIGKHQLGKKETNLQKSLEKYLLNKIKAAKNEKHKDSKRLHDAYLRSEIRDCLGNLYEGPKIELVEVCYSEKELNQREEYWRVFFKGFYPNLLNMMPGGQGGATYSMLGKVGWSRGLTKETDSRLAENGRKISVAKKGKKFESEHCKNIGDALRGKPKSEEHKEKLRGENNGMFDDHRWAGENNPMYGENIKDYMTEEDYELWRKHISESGKIAQNRPEVREAKSKRMSGENHPMFGKHHTEETLEKLRKPKSEEHKKLLRKPHPSTRGALHFRWKPDNHILETRTCECGCGKTFECTKSSKKRFLNGHKKRK